MLFQIQQLLKLILSSAQTRKNRKDFIHTFSTMIQYFALFSFFYSFVIQFFLTLKYLQFIRINKYTANSVPLINIMLLNIQQQKIALNSQIKLVQRIIYKLSSQMRHFKELNQIKIIIKLTQKHMAQLVNIQNTGIQNLANLELEAHLEANNRIKNHIVRKGQQIKAMLGDANLIPFTVLGLGCLAKMKYNLDLIQSKMKALERIVKGINKKKQN